MKLKAFQTFSMFPYTEDDVQDFAIRRDRALLATSEIPQENVHEGLFKMLLQGSEKLQTVSAQAMKD